MSHCIFCKKSLEEVGRSREHIFPQWFQEQWKQGKCLVEPTHYDVDYKVVSKRTHSFSSFLCGHVCMECNIGWMSILETKCKELILELATGRRHLIDVNNSEALLLARWTAKTAYALHNSSNWRRVVPDNHIFKFDTEQFNLPEGVFVIGHTYKMSRELGWSQGTTWEINCCGYDLSDTDLATIKATAYKIGLRIGGLFLLIIHNPFPFARLRLWKYRHIPLYPRRSQPVAWMIADRAWPKDHVIRFHLFVQLVGLVIGNEDAREPFSIKGERKKLIL